MKHFDFSYLPGTAVPETYRTLGGADLLSHDSRINRRLLVLALVVVTLGMLVPAYGQGTNVFNCSSGFSTSGSCGVSLPSGGSGKFTVIGATNGSTPGMSGSQVDLAPTGSTHTALNFDYSGTVNATAFIASYTYVPDGQFTSLTLNNAVSTPNELYGGPLFTSGAGCEGSFYQGFGTAPTSQNRLFAIELDAWSPLTDDNTSPYANFTYSGTQIYQQNQNPCNPSSGPPNYYFTRKQSTYPVPLDSPVNTQGSPTGDTYSVTITYTGSNVTEELYDISKSGSCPGSNCFTYTWNNVFIPQLVDGTTAYVGLAESTNYTSTAPLYIDGFSFTNLSAAAAPSISPSGGTYSGTQSVAISDSSPGSVICYNSAGNPSTNGIGGCINSTQYTSAISVSQGQTIYAVAGSGTSSYGDSSVASSAYNITGTASRPTFNQPPGVWQGAQTVYLTAAHGSVICYNTNGSPATNGSTGCTTGTLYTGPITVSASETLYAVAGGAGFTDSGVGSGAYTISPFNTGNPSGGYPANSPTFSVAPGTYSGAQTVTLASNTANSYICFQLSSTPLTVLPYPNSMGTCNSGTLYSGPISISSSETLYAVAGILYTTSSPGPPSSPSIGTYTIGGGQAPGAPTITNITAVPQ